MSPSRKKQKISVHLVGKRAVVWETEDGNALYGEAFYGKPVGIRKPKTSEFDRPLELDLLEAYYLLINNRITITESKSNKTLSPDQYYHRAVRSFDNFKEKYVVYQDLRKKGYIVKPGLKFGADFAVYEKGPGIDHAPFLVHLNPKGNSLTAIEMVRAGRLATSVRKRFVIATLDHNKEPQYFAFTWFKP